MSYAKATKNILIKNINKLYKHLVNKIKGVYLYYNYKQYENNYRLPKP